LSADFPGHRSWISDLPDDQILDTAHFSYLTNCISFCDGCDGDFLFDCGGLKTRDSDCPKEIKVRLCVRHSKRD